MAGGESPENTLPQLLQDPSQEPSAHHEPISTVPEEPKGRQEPKFRTQRKGDPVWTPAKAVLGKPQCPGVTPITVSQCWSTFWTE